MSAITLTAAQIARVNSKQQDGPTFLIDSGVTLTKGQAASINPTTGKLRLADASTGAENNVRGIVELVSGNVATLQQDGYMYGFDLSSLDYDDPVYLSNTAGGLDTAAGDVSLVVGRVGAMHDSTPPTKVLDVNIRAIM